MSAILLMHQGALMKTLYRILLVTTLAFFSLSNTTFAAPAFKLLYEFPGVETGFQPSSGVIFDASGNLYGELTEWDYNTGMVYKLSPNPNGTWTEAVLYEFTGGADGATPEGGLIFDSAGNLYGTANHAFGFDPGVVFKLTPNPDGSWTESVIYSFTGGEDGSFPNGGVIFDTAGNLYGTARYGGNFACQGAEPGCGVVFKLAPNPDGSWTQSVLYAFSGGDDGSNPVAGLIVDESGNLYGTTVAGGLFNCVDGGCGTVFKLAPQPDGSWMHSVILIFPGVEGGGEPSAPVVFDAVGNLYGTTTRGGTSQNGIVFQLQKNLDGSWTENVLHRFSSHKGGRLPDQGLTLDTSGKNLYGTTSYDSYYGAGTAFRLKEDPSGNWRGNTMYQFGQGNSGGRPFRMSLDSAGNLYGTTAFGGSYGYGTVFELMRPPH